MDRAVRHLRPVRLAGWLRSRRTISDAERDAITTSLNDVAAQVVHGDTGIRPAAELADAVRECHLRLDDAAIVALTRHLSTIPATTVQDGLVIHLVATTFGIPTLDARAHDIVARLKTANGLFVHEAGIDDPDLVSTAYGYTVLSSKGDETDAATGQFRRPGDLL